MAKIIAETSTKFFFVFTFTKDWKLSFSFYAPKYRKEEKWVTLSQEAWDLRSGRPITIHNNANIELLSAIIEKNPHINCDILKVETFINSFTLGEIICNSLYLRKLLSRLKPHCLNDKNE